MLSKNDIEKLSKLARISISEAESAAMIDDLNGLVTWIEQLSAIDVDGVEPMVGVGADAMPFRDDTVTQSNQPEDILANAPDAKAGYFVVQKVLE